MMESYSFDDDVILAYEFHFLQKKFFFKTKFKKINLANNFCKYSIFCVIDVFFAIEDELLLSTTDFKLAR